MMKRLSVLSMCLVLTVTMIFGGDYVYAEGQDYSELTATEQGILQEKSIYVGSGIKQTQIVSVDAELKQHIDYVFEIDLNDPTTGIIAGYKDYHYDHEDTSTWGLATVPEQIASAEEKTGLNIVGGINGDFFNMSTGEPTGVLIMDGKVVHENSRNRNFFAIKKDGTAVIVRNQSPVKAKRYQFAIGGDVVVVKNGELTSAALNAADNPAARTAIGIKADGSVVMHVTSGVNSPVTHGYNFREVAKIMRDRGCVDVLMLDGGGSSTFASKYEGEENVSVRNNPADGTERQVCTCLMITSSKGPSEDNANLTTCEKEGHQYRHNNGWINCESCDYTAATEAFSGLAKDEVTGKWILFEKGKPETGFVPFGEDEAYYFEQDGYGEEATLIEKVDSDCTMRGYRKYINSAEKTYQLLDVTACGHDYESVNGERICEKCGWVQVSVEDCDIRLSSTTLGYNGKTRTPSISVYAPNGKKLVSRKIYNSGDFSATVANNTEIGTATLTFEPLWYYVNITEERGTIIGTKVVEYKILPSPATNLVINQETESQAELSWTASKSAGFDYVIEYDIYQKEESADWVKIGTTTDTTFTAQNLKPDFEYEFRILATAEGKDGNRYDSWKYAEGKTMAIVHLETPVVSVGNVAKTGKIKLTWKEVEHADAYVVYRATAEEGPYKKMKTTTETSYTNTTAKSANLYYYQVQAVYEANERLNSELSQPVKRRCDLARPAVSVSNDEETGKVKLTWNSVAKAEKYKIYRSTSENGSYSYVNTTNETSYINKNAKAGTTYYYKVKAVNADFSSATSAFSLVDKRACDLARPVVTASNDAKTGKVNLTWKKVSGADKYKIFRAMEKNGTYSYINTVTGTSYTHKGAKKGKTYWYKVKAIDADKSSANSAFSVVVNRKCK